MTRTRKTPPRFLQDMLSDTKAALVRRELKPFLVQVKQDSKGKLPSLTSLLRSFVSHLARSDG